MRCYSLNIAGYRMFSQLMEAPTTPSGGSTEFYEPNGNDVLIWLTEGITRSPMRPTGFLQPRTRSNQKALNTTRDNFGGSPALHQPVYLHQLPG